MSSRFYTVIQKSILLVYWAGPRTRAGESQNQERCVTKNIQWLHCCFAETTLPSEISSMIYNPLQIKQAFQIKESLITNTSNIYVKVHTRDLASCAWLNSPVCTKFEKKQKRTFNSNVIVLFIKCARINTVFTLQKCC